MASDSLENHCLDACLMTQRDFLSLHKLRGWRWRNSKTKREFHINFFIQRTMYEYIIHIKLENSPTPLASHNLKTLNSGKHHNRGESFTVVYTLPLSISSNDKSNFEYLNRTIWFALNLVNSFTKNALLIREKMENIISLISGKNLKFLQDSLLLGRVWIILVV